MNIKNYSVLLTIFTIMLSQAQAYDSYTSANTQYGARSSFLTDAVTPSRYDLLFLPVRMTPSGLELFFESVYNTKQYSEEFLPNNFSHLTQFLKHAQESEGDREYIKATISLFSQKLKGCSYANAYKFEEFIHELPDLIGYVFEAHPQDEEAKKSEIEKLLADGFINKWKTFKQDPQGFMENLSSELLRIADQDAYEDVPLEYLRQSLIRFIEIGLSKIIWDPRDPELWSHVTQLADNLMNLTDTNIVIDMDDMNDLYWSLLHRLRYFIDVTAGELQSEFFEDAIKATQQTETQLLALEEQEELITTKRHTLQKALYDCLAKAQAQKSGLIIDAIPV